MVGEKGGKNVWRKREGGKDRKRRERKKDERRVARGQEGKREWTTLRSRPVARRPPVKGPTAIRIRGALSDRDSQPHERPGETETNEQASERTSPLPRHREPFLKIAFFLASPLPLWRT